MPLLGLLQMGNRKVPAVIARSGCRRYLSLGGILPVCCMREMLRCAVYSMAHRIVCIAHAAKEKLGSVDARKQLGALKREAQKMLQRA